MVLALLSLQSLVTEKKLAPALQNQLHRCIRELHAIIDKTDAVRSQRQQTGGQLVNLSRRLHECSHFIAEMAGLEEKMRDIAGEGQSLLGRLRSFSTTPPAQQSDRNLIPVPTSVRLLR